MSQESKGFGRRSFRRSRLSQTVTQAESTITQGDKHGHGLTPR
jgi:hypothetical protein